MTEHAATTVTLTGTEPPGVLEALSRLGRYRIVEYIGAGGMGVVYRAFDPSLDREVAIKLVMAEDEDDRDAARLLREARAMAQVHHANVMPVYDVGTMGNDVYIVMPFFRGGTLGSWLREAAPSWREIVTRFVAAGRGLTAAHAVGLVHRDFKPENVLLGEAGEIRVADFGLARPPAEHASSNLPVAVTTRVTRTGAVAGTPRYMAPEQLAAAPLDARCDQFSFAVTLWTALFGAHPFGIDHRDNKLELVELVRRILAGPVVPPAHRIPNTLVVALRRALSALPAERWPTLDELLDEIEPIARPRRRKLVMLAGTATAGLAVAALAFGLANAGDELPTVDEVVLEVDAREAREELREARNLLDYELRRRPLDPILLRRKARFLSNRFGECGEAIGVWAMYRTAAGELSPDEEREVHALRVQCDRLAGIATETDDPVELEEAAARAWRTGDYDTARRALERSMLLGKKPTLLITLGDVARSFGHCDAARTYYERFVAEAPPHVPRDERDRIAARANDCTPAPPR